MATLSSRACATIHILSHAPTTSACDALAEHELAPLRCGLLVSAVAVKPAINNIAGSACSAVVCRLASLVPTLELCFHTDYSPSAATLLDLPAICCLRDHWRKAYEQKNRSESVMVFQPPADLLLLSLKVIFNVDIASP